MTIEARPSRTVVRFSGADAEKLLGDVLTPAVSAAEGPARWFALLSPQGKVQAEGLIGWANGAFWADVEGTLASEFFRRMRLYRLRAQVTMENLSETHRVGWSPEPVPGEVVHADTRVSGLGFRVIADADAANGWVHGDTHVRARIAAGVAELGGDFPTDSVFPHDIGMDLLGGVDFKKGCYVGQEVVSRMQHRGTARRRPVIVSGIEAPTGSPLNVGEREAGIVGQVVDGRAVAILRLDRVTDPSAATVGGRPVTLTLPAWATYTFGESAAAE